MEQNFTNRLLSQLRHYAPDATAEIKGSAQYPELRGTVSLWQTRQGAVVLAEVQGLPQPQGNCAHPVFGFHIHEGTSCTGNAEDPFADALTHYNPEGCEHPAHAGDLPPLFSNHGQAWMAVLTDRFEVRDVIGKTVIVHSQPDDFKTQPSGDSGSKIACGIIRTTWN